MSRSRVRRRPLATETLILVAAVLAVLMWIDSSSLLAGDPAPTVTAGAAASDVDVAAARRQLETMTVASALDVQPYDRRAFGSGWLDLDGTGCDARADVQARELTDIEMVPGEACEIAAGVLPYDPYTGQENVTYQRGSTSEGLDTEHIVALGNAWMTGAQQWTADRREQFANDPANLLLVDAGENRSKGDRDASEWLPANAAYRCPYVARQVAIKAAYGLWVTPAEYDAMARVLRECPNAAAMEE